MTENSTPTASNKNKKGGSIKVGRLSDWKAPPRWTKSPNKKATYSDWEIDVTVKSNVDDDIVVTYYVHRFALGMQSKYFKELIEKKDNEEVDDDDVDGQLLAMITQTSPMEEEVELEKQQQRQKNRNAIELPGPTITIEQFETLLDYCYTARVPLHENNIVAMIYFGEYFRIRPLEKHSKDFIVRSIREFVKSNRNTDEEKSELLAAYYLEAKCLSSSLCSTMMDLQNAIAERCAGQPALLKKGTALFNMLDTMFWKKVWSARKKYTNETAATTQKWSTNLAQFMDAYPEEVDYEFFFEMTHIDSLSFVSPEASVILMNYERRLCWMNENDTQNELTCLQKRCTEAMYNRETKDWQIPNDADFLLEGSLRNLPPILLEQLLLLAINPEHAMKCKNKIPDINSVMSTEKYGQYASEIPDIKSMMSMMSTKTTHTIDLNDID